MFVHTPDSPTVHDNNGSAPCDLGGGDGSSTLHTPELLNSLAALAPPAFPASYSQYQESAGGGGPPPPPPPPLPAVQQTASSLVKEGLKVSIRSRRAACAQPMFADDKVDVKGELTHVDEARRQRRRERNKVAATKCRNKKKIETQHLIVDSEVQVNQHNSLRLEIMQLLQERSQLMSALTSHLPCCTSGCADTTAAALSRCRRTPPPEVPRPLSPLTPITSPDSERRPSGGSTCSWSSLGEMALESVPYGGGGVGGGVGGGGVGGGFPCGGTVMAMTPSPSASPSYSVAPPAAAQYGMYGVAGGLVLGAPVSAPAAMAAPHGGPRAGLMSPPAACAKMGVGSPTQCHMYAMPPAGYMQQSVSTPVGGGEYSYYGCLPAGAAGCPPAGGGYGSPFAGYGGMC